jgi:hypothetical protein
MLHRYFYTDRKMQAEQKPGLFDSPAAIEKLMNCPKRRAMWLSGTS